MNSSTPLNTYALQSPIWNLSPTLNPSLRNNALKYSHLHESMTLCAGISSFSTWNVISLNAVLNNVVDRSLLSDESATDNDPSTYRYECNTLLQHEDIIVTLFTIIATKYDDLSFECDCTMPTPWFRWSFN